MHDDQNKAISFQSIQRVCTLLTNKICVAKSPCIKDDLWPSKKDCGGGTGWAISLFLCRFHLETSSRYTRTMTIEIKVVIFNFMFVTNDDVNLPPPYNTAAADIRNGVENSNILKMDEIQYTSTIPLYHMERKVYRRNCIPRTPQGHLPSTPGALYNYQCR